MSAMDGGVFGRALFADLYQLTMAQAYVAEGATDTAVFTLFVRRLPPARRYLLACGVATVVEQLERLRFTDGDLAYLRSLGRLSEACVEWLSRFRFSGDVHAVAEGTPIFANEPILEVVAPLPEAQLVETLVMNQIHVQTLLASKAARVVTAAAGRRVIDFGMRRMHGIDAAIVGARAAYIAGADATSNLFAGRQFGIPVAGTMAHSYVQAHDDESEAFHRFASEFPDTVLLVDTYDTLEGVRRLVELVRTMPSVRVSAVRLDSGNLRALAPEVRRLLDAAGLHHVGIMASSELDEYEISALVDSGVPIDSFGVGTQMGVSADEPALEIVYKLVDYAGCDRTKLSAGKPVLPGKKQVFRQEADGRATGDVIAGAEERLPGRPLLEMVMRNGLRTPALVADVAAIRASAAAQLARLPNEVRCLAPGPAGYHVSTSAPLERRHQDSRLRVAALSARV
jgi:nicotinate phosphoribosyltransferase